MSLAVVALAASWAACSLAAAWAGMPQQTGVLRHEDRPARPTRSSGRPAKAQRALQRRAAVSAERRSKRVGGLWAHVEGACGPFAFYGLARAAAGVFFRRAAAEPRGRQLGSRRRWSFFGWGEPEEEAAMSELDTDLQTRFLSYAEGEGDDARMRFEGLRNLLECTETFCLTKHWLPESYVEQVFEQYAGEDGIGLHEFTILARDGLLLKGRLEEYEKAFNSIDVSGEGVISRSAMGKLFAGLGRVMSPMELDKIVDDADVGHDGIDFADFLGLARSHLDLGEVLGYVASKTRPQDAQLPVDLASPLLQPGAELGRVTEVHGENELNAIVAHGDDVIVELAFTWCRPCKAFWPKYQKFAKVYTGTRFIKIVGNENESCKHYARDVLHAKISPMFAVYSEGKLVNTWSGANNERFIQSIEEGLPSAAAVSQERVAAVAADADLAPKQKK